MEDIEEMLTCAICLDFYNSPRKLPCHHVYCVECLRGLVDQFTAVLHCPECRAKHIVPNVDRIPVDYRIIKFVEIQKNLTTLTLSEEGVNEVASGSEAAGTSQKEPVFVEEDLIKLESMVMRELRDLFTLIDEQGTKDTMLTQKKLLLKKKAAISITRKYFDIATEDVKKELDKRRDELNQQLDEQAGKIDEELKKFDFMKTVSEDLTKYKNITKYKNSLFDTNCSHNDMLRVRADLQENKNKITELMSIGTSHQARNSVSFEKSVNELKFAIQQFGELIVMDDSQLERETRNLPSERETEIDYSKTWNILAVADETEPRGLTVNPHNDHIYAAVDSGIVEYDLAGRLVKRYVTNDGPSSVTFDRKQRMIVTSINEYNIKIYDCEGNKLSQFGCYGDGPGEFNFPSDVASDLDGRLYITDYSNSRIQVLNSDGKFIFSIKEKKRCPTFIHMDNNKTSGDWPRLFASDYGNNKIVMFDVKGDNCTFVGEVDVQSPGGICQDKDGNILVAGRDDEVIYVLDKNGKHVSRIREPREALERMDGITITDSGVLFVASYHPAKSYFLHQPDV